MDQRALPQTTEGLLASVSRQSELLFNDPQPISPISFLDHWNDPYPAATFKPTPSGFQTPFPKKSDQLSIPSPPLAAKQEVHRKRKRCSNEYSARKSMRQDSSRDSKANTATGGDTGRSNSPSGTHSRHGSEHSDQQGNNHSLHKKERNRTAASKFRVKKREYTLRVQSEEQELERTNHDLSICVASLSREVQELKMKLLQHNDCDCSLIHDYLAAEAQRYICGLSKQSQLEAISASASANPEDNDDIKLTHDPYVSYSNALAVPSRLVKDTGQT
ncbi:hypothetical protein FBEOM_5356 [Fusarium beomiforme]|uniref:BZIP domain-containing protein n=1 Tax=Fusarium beomiforme TaxID=44412 RepID=A0A9P5AMT4_9HYPO|nr:hypothetical protein FBEOM_5356 [Fusarium beomiforme]